MTESADLARKRYHEWLNAKQRGDEKAEKEKREAFRRSLRNLHAQQKMSHGDRS